MHFRLWTGNRTTGVAKSSSILRFLRGQLLAIGVAAAALAALYAMRPIFGHSVYLFCGPALLACAAYGGAGAALTAALLMTAGGFTLDGMAGMPALERGTRAALFLALGLSITAWVRSSNSEGQRPSAWASWD